MFGTFRDGEQRAGRLKMTKFKKMKMDILIISETKRTGSGTESIGDVFHCWSGIEKRKGQSVE